MGIRERKREVVHKFSKSMVRIDPDLRKRIKVLAAKWDVAPYEILEEAVRQYLKENEERDQAPRPIEEDC